jgi:hypothetical protein
LGGIETFLPFTLLTTYPIGESSGAEKVVISAI